MDQSAVLEWIERNIAAFGGDPKCVTIAGQSSGSISVSILMTSLPAKGLFQRAIGESGGLFWAASARTQVPAGERRTRRGEYAASRGAASLKYLRRRPATQLTGNAGGILHAVIEPYLLSAFTLRGIRFLFAEKERVSMAGKTDT